MESGFVEYPFDQALHGDDPLVVSSHPEEEHYRLAEIGRTTVDALEVPQTEAASTDGSEATSS